MELYKFIYLDTDYEAEEALKNTITNYLDK